MAVYPRLTELVAAFEALPDFDTLQILHVPAPPPHPMYWCGQNRCGNCMLHVEQWEQEAGQRYGGSRGIIFEGVENQMPRGRGQEFGDGGEGGQVEEYEE